MRVLLVGTLNSPHIVDMSQGLADAGVEVHLAGTYDRAVPMVTSPGAASIRRLPPGLPVPRFRVQALWLRGLLSRLRPDIVHAHYLSIFGCIAAYARPSAPLAISLWGSDIYRLAGAGHRRARHALWAADLLLADSRHLLGSARRLAALDDENGNVAPWQEEVIQWGVDLRVFKPLSNRRAELRAQLGLGEAPVILSTRALRPLYNIPVILDAFVRLKRTFPDAQLVIKHPSTGSPAWLSERATSLGIGESIRLVGHTDVVTLVSFYQVADVCVSVPDSDSSPRSVWEAMACGCPCVLSDLPWVHELLEPGRDALAIPPRPAAVAEAIVKLLTDRDTASRIAEAALVLIHAEMNRDYQLRRLIGLYRNLVYTGQSVEKQ